MKLSTAVRLKILLLIFLTIGPTIGLLIYFGLSQLRDARADQVQQLAVIANLVATEYSQINEGARQLLISLSSSPQLSSPIPCHRYLSELLSKYQRYANFGVVNPQGQVTCSAISSPHPVNLSHRYFFQRTLSSNDFTVGEYSIGPITQSPILNFGYPLPHRQGIVYASLDLTWLGEILKASQPHLNSVLVIYDRQGTVLAGFPNPQSWAGQVNFSPTTQSNLTYATQKAGPTDAGPFVAVGVPTSSIFNPPTQQFKQNLLLTVIAGLGSLLVGWAIGNSLITHLLSAKQDVENLKNDFVSLVTHQLRTPLTAIKWFTGLLSSSTLGRLTPRQKDILTNTQASVNRMIKLVNTLLTISKLESGHLPLNPQLVSVKSLVTNCAKDVSTTHLHKHIKLQINVANSVPNTLHADSSLFPQVLMNLLSNAFQYSPPKTQVFLSIKTLKNAVLFSVADQGPGIPKTDMAKLWQKFSRGTNATRTHSQGAGLGLYLSKLIIEAHGGKIWCISTPKLGSKFYFTLPAQTA